MERERNSGNGEETTLELNDQSSSEGSETTEIDIVPSTGISKNIKGVVHRNRADVLFLINGIRVAVVETK